MIKKDNKVDILLATYNGEKYLHQLLDSIMNQSYDGWSLIIRDDNSTDNTVNILKYYQSRFPHKISIVEDDLGTLGACKNFENILLHSNANYFMFADQDDVWMPEKVEVSMNKMIEIEAQNKGLPVIIHTDLTVVDKDLNIIEKSFWKHNKIDIHSEGDINKLIYGNIATGCTMILNKRAKEISLPFPKQLRVHDWWLNMQVANRGKVCHIDTPLILYRQHDSNIIGARKSNPSMLKILKNFNFYKNRINNQYDTAIKIIPNLNYLKFTINLFMIELYRKLKYYQH